MVAERTDAAVGGGWRGAIRALRISVSIFGCAARNLPIVYWRALFVACEWLGKARGQSSDVRVLWQWHQCSCGPYVAGPGRQCGGGGQDTRALGHARRSPARNTHVRGVI